MIGFSKAAFLAVSLAGVSAFAPVFGQTSPAKPAGAADDHASAYYNFAMAHLYAEMAASYGNRGEYVNKAIDLYKQAIKLDPSATYIEEELTDFYIQTSQLEKATDEAQSLLKADPNNANAHKILARIYSRQVGDPDQGRIDQTMLKNAIEQYQKASQLDPKDVESLSMLARLSRVAKDDATAEKAYRQVLEIDPDDEDSLNGLAMVFADRGDMGSATEMLKKAVEKNPDPRNVVMLAEFYDQANDFQHGADTWKQAVDLTNGANMKVLQAYADDCFKAGRFDDALKAVQDLAVGDPKNAKLQLEIAELLEKKQDYAGATAALAKAKAIGNTPDVRYAEAELLNAQGKHTEAIAAMQSLLDDTKKASYNQEERSNRLDILSHLGAFQQEAGKTQDAIASFRQIADLDPSLAPKVEAQIIETLRLAKDFKGARQAADAAIKKFPSDRSLVIMHATLMADLGQPDTAVNELKSLPDALQDRELLLTYVAPVQEKAKHFDEERKTLDAADSLSKTPQEKSAVEFVRGAMYEREKNYDAAEKAFRSVLDKDPNNAGAMNYLGYMFADRGVRLEEARQLISKALDIDPGNPAYIDSLAWVHYHLNELDQASDELRKALDKIGDDPTVHDHLGDVYFKQGKFREAIQQWEASVSEYKSAAPSDRDPVELAKVTKKLEGAKVKAAQTAR